MPSVVVLTIVLVGLLTLTDEGGFLSTDVGGKIATLEAMDRRGDLIPDLGYWAESADPDGSLYPMWSTAHVGDRWVNATTLPMLYLALPLYAVAGAHGAGLIPVLGTVLAALGARALANRLGGDGDLAFWIVGLASPATVYALDFWEHSLALGLMVWAVVAALDAASPGRGWRAAIVAGLLFGAAATMRQEALVYGFVTGVAVGARLLWMRRPLTAAARGAAMAAGALSMLAANAALEAAAIGSATRTSRSTDTAASFGSGLGRRVEEAIVTGASPFAQADPTHLLLAIAVATMLVVLGRRALSGAPVRPVALGLAAVAALVAVDLIVDGRGFVPGLAATTPVAMLALARPGGTPERWMVAAVAVGALPLVWAVQYTGGAGPQWGGRYILLTGTLLVALATAVFTAPETRRVLVATALAGGAVTALGVVWTVERTHSFATAMEELAARDEPALVFHDPHLAREGGVLVLDEQWLAATGEEARAEAAEVLTRLGIAEIGFVQHDRGDDPLVLPGWTVTADDRVALVSGLYLRVTTQTAPG